MTPTVSVVVTTLQRADRIGASLAETLAATAPAEVVVVDDGSTDDTPRVLAELAAAHPQLKHIRQENAGQWQALLTGTRAATGEVVLLLDDDVVPAPGIVPGHAAHHAEAERLVVFGRMPVPPAPVTRTSWPRDIYAKSYEDHCVGWERSPDDVLEHVWSGHLSMRRTDFLALAERLVDAPLGYHRDTDFGMCAADDGLTGRFDRALGGRHELERTPAAFLRNAASSGRDWAEVEARHPVARTQGMIRPLPFGLTGLALRPRGAPAVAALIGVAVRALGLASAWELQRRAGGLAWRVLQLQSYAARTRELAA